MVPAGHPPRHWVRWTQCAPQRGGRGCTDCICSLESEDSAFFAPCCSAALRLALDLTSTRRAEVSRIYKNARMEGCHEIQDVLVAFTTELQGFNFYDSFTDAFSVSNKCIEVLMLRAGVDCGCSSEADR